MYDGGQDNAERKPDRGSVKLRTIGHLLADPPIYGLSSSEHALDLNIHTWISMGIVLSP